MASSKDGRDIHIDGRVDELQIHIVGFCKPSLPHEEDTEIAKPSSVGRLDGCHSGGPGTVVRTPPEPGGHRGDRASRDATAQELASVDSTRCTPVAPLITTVHWRPPFLRSRQEVSTWSQAAAFFSTVVWLGLSCSPRT